MAFECEIDAARLRELLAAVSGAVLAADNTPPAWGWVRLEALEDNRLMAKACNNAVSISAIMPAMVAKAGRIAVGGVIDRIAKTLRGAVAIRTSTAADGGNEVVLVSRGARFTLPLRDADVMAEVLTHGSTGRIVIEAADLREAITRTRFAISRDPTRAYLCGLHVDPLNGLRLVATDGARMAVQPVDASCRACDPLTIPANTVALIEKLAPRDGRIGIDVASSAIAIQLGGDCDVEIVSRLVGAEFPNYERVIPQHHEAIVHVDRDELIAAVDLVDAIGSDGVRLVVDISAMEITVSASSRGDLGHARTHVALADVPDAGGAGGGRHELGFDAGYLKAALGAIATDTVVVRIGEPGAPTVFTATGAPGYRHVLMGLRLSRGEAAWA